MRLLLVEDDVMVASGIKLGLTDAGYAVDWVGSGERAEEVLAAEPFDAAIIDIGLPKMDGLELTRRLRRPEMPSHAMPVLILTARDALQDRVQGLDLGADDYLVKPFAFSELLARVRTLLRRGNAATLQTQLRIADLEVDLLKRRATRAGQRIDLTAKEFALLELLLRRRGEVLPKSLIASQVWDMNFDSDTNVIEVAIRRLRAKIDDGFEPKLIHTARGMGYMLDEPDAP